jgi:hypothetical protein
MRLSSVMTRGKTVTGRPGLIFLAELVSHCTPKLSAVKRAGPYWMAESTHKDRSNRPKPL